MALLDRTLKNLGKVLRDRADPITREPLPANLQSLLNKLDAPSKPCLSVRGHCQE